MGFLYPICLSLSSKSVSTFEKLRKEKEKKLSPTQHDTRTEKQTKQKISICFISHGHRTLKLNPNLPCFPLILENQNTLTFSSHYKTSLPHFPLILKTQKALTYCSHSKKRKSSVGNDSYLTL